MHSNGSSPTPYYETALNPSESIFIAFQEILARPLINNFLVGAETYMHVILGLCSISVFISFSDPSCYWTRAVVICAWGEYMFITWFVGNVMWTSCDCLPMQLMEWALTKRSANIMTYLRHTGYHIPLELIQRYPEIVRDYLLGKSIVMHCNERKRERKDFVVPSQESILFSWYHGSPPLN